MNGWGVRRAGSGWLHVFSRCGRETRSVCCWYHESGFGFSSASLCVTLLWLRSSSSGHIPPTVTKHFLFHIPMKRLQTFCWWCTCTEKNYYSEIIIILISQACNLFLCRLGLAISSGCALEEWHMAICAWGLVTEHFIHAKCTLPTYIFFFFKEINTFIQQECITLIKSNCKHQCYKLCSFELRYLRILKNIIIYTKILSRWTVLNIYNKKKCFLSSISSSISKL